MDQKVSVRLSPPAAEYLAKLQAEKGGSLSDVVRDLIEQTRQRNQAGDPPASLADAAQIHECCRYTASLLTGLVRQVATNKADAEALIEKAIADAGPASGPASVPDTEEK